MTHIKVMKQALEVLKAAYVPADLDEQREKAITAIKQVIAQDALDKKAENARELGLDYETPPVQEPVAYDKTEMNCFVQELYDKKMCEGKHGHYETMFHCVHQAIKRVTPPAAQKQWVGLTDEEVENFVATLWPLAEEPVRDRLRAIEAKLKEKNHA